MNDRGYSFILAGMEANGETNKQKKLANEWMMVGNQSIILEGNEGS